MAVPKGPVTTSPSLSFSSLNRNAFWREVIDAVLGKICHPKRPVRQSLSTTESQMRERIHVHEHTHTSFPP
ncbi:hypothetical protein Mapa_002728 [Marchantia paleacea]|nr:hypothetical protein Mapa_002728 [Marchantia paleacea]